MNEQTPEEIEAERLRLEQEAVKKARLEKEAADKAAADKKAEKKAAKQAKNAEPEPELDAATRLRAFEDEHLGPDAVRISGHVERGVGSPYSRLNPARHRHYQALEKAVASEQKLGAAHAALIQADADHEAVMAELAAAESAPDDPAA
jgi:hypothetical protein